MGKEKSNQKVSILFLHQEGSQWVWNEIHTVVGLLLLIETDAAVILAFSLAKPEAILQNGLRDTEDTQVTASFHIYVIQN